jgi:beta-lactamase superfamily II metal-dependent hydrolase
VEPTPPASSGSAAPQLETTRRETFEGLRETKEPRERATRWTLEAIDVGTGLAIFVQGPDFALLYDAGSNDDDALGDKNRALAFLRAVHPKLSRIDHIILSHPHKDHVELLPDIIAAYAVGDIYDSGRVNEICGYRRFLDEIDAKGGNVAYHTVKHPAGAGTVAFPALNNCEGKKKLAARSFKFKFADQIEVGTEIQLGQGASLKFLHANASDMKATGGDLSPNENSLVVRLQLGPHVILLPGDAEAGERKTWPKAPTKTSAEGEVLACCKDDIDAEILIASHHGSMTSSRTAFLEAVSPKIVIVSSGPHAYSGTTLPDADVIKSYAATGAKVFTTKPDADEEACKSNGAKIGPDDDGKPGGCDNVRLTLTSEAGDPDVEVWTQAD